MNLPQSDDGCWVKTDRLRPKPAHLPGIVWVSRRSISNVTFGPAEIWRPMGYAMAKPRIFEESITLEGMKLAA
jgi:hypothetical protein